MIRNTPTRIAAAALVLVHTAAQADTKWTPGTYQIDPAHSKIGFEIPHLVISTVEGRFNGVKGDIVVDKLLTKSSVQTEVDVATIDTGVKQRDDHLKSAEFFEVAKFPTMIFKSKRVEGSPDTFKLIGDLTIHGVTKEVIFDAKYLGSVLDASGNQKMAFDAKSKINRKDFGLTWGKMVEVGPVVGDTVTLVLRVQAAKAPDKVTK